MPPWFNLDRALRVIAFIAVLGAAAFAVSSPPSFLAGGAAWMLTLVSALSGGGHVLAHVARVPSPDLGLRATWGAAGFLALMGPLIAVGLGNRTVVVGLVGIGVAAHGWREFTTTIPTWRRIADAHRVARLQPALTVLVSLIAALAVVRVLGGIATLDRSPWDDDLAYTPLVKRLLDTGDLVEPFSLRRLGAYGGQTALQALVGARGTLVSVHLLDQALGLTLTMLLMAGMAHERRTRPLWQALLALVVLLLPNTAINTASYWTGAMFLLGLYRTALRAHWGLMGLLAAATCTLRQSYLPIVALFVGAVLLARLLEAGHARPWRDAWRAERRPWGVGVGVTMAALIGWWIAAWASSGTFLFPIVGGTFNPAISLAPTAMTTLQELRFLVTCLIETTPLVVIPPLFIVLVVSRDDRRGRPMTALALAVSLGFVLLVHGFAGSEAAHLWRYAFGPAIALLAVLVLELGVTDVAADDASVPVGAYVRIPPIARWLLLSALVLQLVVTRGAVPKLFAGVAADVREALSISRAGDPSARGPRARHAALQAAIPAGTRVAVMLDEPAYLDFARNSIVNLDHPGYASPGDRLPAFEGPDAWRAYLASQDIRYVAFVRSEASRYFFRRAFWVWRMFNDAEIYQAMSAYTIDAIDTLAALATATTVLYDADGLVVLDLGTPTRRTSPRAADEPARRARFIHEVARQEDLLDAWSLSSRADVLFEDGFSSMVVLADATVDDPAWFQVVQRPSVTPERGTPVRWLSRRAHARLKGDQPMRLVLRGKVNLAAVYTRPRLEVALEGEQIATTVVDEQGGFAIAVDVPAAPHARGWRDLYLVWSTVADPAADARDLRVARLLELGWQPLVEAPR